ncbi:MAG TPA: prolyl oligopeptidase family serine peptidase [Salinivirgaceae bacterium]|mgnify:CR=1 FL=1|nr:prolyl oligopeptidase family serine peptidase [Salinivirgaceae bacterium]
MKKQVFMFIFATLLASSCSEHKKIKVTYPESAKVDTVDTYFGHAVPDPYRWLEDDNSEATKAWVTAQNAVTENYLKQIPFRDQIKARLTKLWDYPKSSAPFKKGGYYFVFKNNGLQNQSVAYFMKNLGDEPQVLLDPNALSEDGTVSLTQFAVSDDGKYLAYGISRGGSDWNEFFVKEIESGKMLDDHIQWVKFSGITWYNDGFFYSRYPQPKESDVLKGVNEHNKIYYHKIGTPQSQDQLIYEDPQNPKWGYSADLSEDKKFMVIHVTESTSGNAVYIKNMETGKLTVLVDNFQSDYSFIDHIHGKLLFLTNNNAPKYKVIAVDPNNLKSENWIDFLPETGGVLHSVSLVGGKVIAQYMENAFSKVKIYDLAGKYLYDLDNAEIGTIGGFAGKIEDKETFYTMTSFTTPSNIYRYDVENNRSELYESPAIDFDSKLYETKQVFYTSKDGTQVPMFIVHKKGLKLDGKRPTLLYGYGGFNISLTPSFSVTRLIWLENDGVFAMANLRGGGEFGEEWHKAGTKMQKQNVFDDFIAAAEYLINNKYTNPKRLAIQGGSNGGLLVGAVANQRPELFAVALPAVGVMDMLRYHHFTIGRYWATDYGTSEDSEEMFLYLKKYSPLHSIPTDIYPATMITTADHDDRVVPAHSFKFAAALQNTYKGDNPVLIRIETKAGHGAGKPTSMVIQEYADLWAFSFYNMNYTPKVK